MRPATEGLLAKAARSIEAAEDLLHRRGDIDFAAGRAYYAMFYVAQARHFAKPGVLDAKFHRWLLSAFDRRLQADYVAEVPIRREDVELMLQQGREFIAAARQYLRVSE